MNATARKKTATSRRAPAKATKRRKAVAKSPDPLRASQRISQKIASLRDWRGETLAEIRKLIREVDPEVVEEWKWMGTPVWSHEGMYALANAHKDKVKLTFFHGAKLHDPKKLFNAGFGGGKWRAIDFYRGDKIDKAGVKALLREAVAFNTTHSVPKSKGSRERLLRKAPTLLSGDNPQIAKADGDAPVQAYIAAIPGWKRDVARQLDTLVVRNAPQVRKAVKWNSPFYGMEGMGWFLNFHCFTKYIKVAFFRGTSLRPVPPGESKHEEVRYLDIHEDDPIDEELVGRWIRQASELEGWVP